MAEKGLTSDKKLNSIFLHLGSIPQISLAYSAIVLSELNLPALKQKKDKNFQGFSSEPGNVHDGHPCPLSLVSVSLRDKVLGGRIGCEVCQGQEPEKDG